jgi:hypothetical protein
MSSFKYLTLDAKLLAQVEVLRDVSVDILGDLVTVGMSLLEGEADKNLLTTIAASSSTEVETLYLCAQALSALFWECAKGAPKDPNIITAVLGQTGLPANMIEAITISFQKNTARFQSIKSNLIFSSNKYIDLTWRLDMELARRNSTIVTEPKFQLRLDVEEANSKDNDQITSSSTSDNGIKSYHLQADYANLKRLQIELQKAISEVEGTHSLRIQKYLS